MPRKNPITGKDEPESWEQPTPKDQDPHNQEKLPEPGGTAQSQMSLEKTPEELKDQREKEEDKKKSSDLFSETTEKDGVKTVVSATSEDAAKEAKKNVDENTPSFVNLTAAINLGNPGQTNLTRDGMLNGDLSVRDTRDPEDIIKELEDKTGPNPTPNRIGNEVTNAMSAFRADAFAIPGDAVDLRGLNQEDKDKINEEVRKLRQEQREKEKQEV